MLRCSYCKKPLDRHVFCGASCKTMYHRKRKNKASKFLKESANSGLCTHGNKKGECIHGC